MKFEDNIVDFFFDLKLDRINMVFDGIEVLLLLFLPFQQSLYSLKTYHFPIDGTRSSFLFINSNTKLLNAFGKVENTKLMAIMPFFVAIAVPTLLAEKRPTVTSRINADMSDVIFVVFGAAKGQSPYY